MLLAVLLGLDIALLASTPHAAALLGALAPFGIVGFAAFVGLGYPYLKAQRALLRFGWGLFAGHLAAGTKLILADGSVPAPPDVTGFGLCLLHAIQGMLADGYGAACVLNSDSPTLPTFVLAQAAAELLRPGERMVLGPADDGGYYLLGMTHAHAHLFADIAWSTAGVAAATRQRARTLGLDIVELPTWYDVDDVSALAQLQQQIADGRSVAGLRPYEAPATAAALRRLGLAGTDRVVAA